MRLPLRYHLERQTGAVSQVLTNGLQGYQLVLRPLVYNILPIAAELGTIVLILIRFHHGVFLALFCAAIVCYTVAFAYAAMGRRAAARRASASQVEANAVMTDCVLNYETVKYFTAESAVEERVAQALMRTEDEWARFYRRFALNGVVIATIFGSFLAFTIVYAASEVHDGVMTVGEFVLVNTYMLQVVRPVETLGNAVQSLAQGLALLENMLELFHERTEPSSACSGNALEGPGRLDFEDVRLSYRSGQLTLRGVSFRLLPGKTLGIVGASGAGKSSLVRLLVRLIEPDSGCIRLDGVPISDLPLARLREAVAVVPQDTILFNDTIAYNISFGRRGCTIEDVERAAQLSHLHEFIGSLPEGYKTRVGERGVKLSGGEKQRVAIARAAIKKPQIYVFDEATSSLDSATERAILRNFREISRSSTTLVIAHRLSTVVHADEIVVLEDGRIVERGTHASLLHAHGRYTELWRAQHGVVDHHRLKDNPAA
jgi:ATP-binding cassette subfamily B protein